MRIEFTFSRDADYFLGQLSVAAWRRTRVLRSAAWFAIAAGAGLAVAFHGTAAGLAAGCGLVLTGVVALLVRRRWFARLITVPASWHSPRRWLITADGLESTTELSAARFEWSTFRVGVVRDEAYLLIQDGPKIVDIPRLPLTAEQDTELNAFLRERGILSPAAGR